MSCSSRSETRRCHRLRETLLVLSVRAAPTGHQIVKGQAGQRPQVAVALQSGQPLPLLHVEDATAGKSATEVGVIEGDVPPNEARPAAQRANALVRWLSGGRDVGIGQRGSAGVLDPLQYLVQLFHSPGLPPPIA